MRKLFSTLLSSGRNPVSAPALQDAEPRYSLFASPQTYGCVDGIFGDEIRGWIVDESEPNRYLKLCLFANGKFVEKTSTCVFRKDLEQRFQSKGLHGFAFRIPEDLQEKPELTVEIRLEDSRQLCGPSVLRNPAPGRSLAGSRRKPCLLVMHIPKTAVTAVRSALRSDALTDRQLWLYGDPPGFPAEHIHYLTESQLQRVECVWGHFPLGLDLLLPQPAEYTTVLRDPVERCISHYFQERFKSPDPGHPARHLAFNEFVDCCRDIAYDNLMVRMIAGMTSSPLGSITHHALQQAIENIHRRFCYIGLQHRTTDAVKSLAHYLNLRPNPLQLENMGLYQRQDCASPAAIRKLRGLNRYDFELFEYVQKTFWFTGAEGWIRPPVV